MSSDPFQYLANAGNSSETWILVGGPIALFFVAALAFFIWIKVRRRREKQELEREYDRRDEALPTKSDAIVIPAREASVAEVPVVTEVPPSQKAQTPQEKSIVDEIREDDQTTWVQRLRAGLARTREALSGSLKGVFSGRVVLSDEILERIHETLFRADIGVKTADRLVSGLKRSLAGKEADWSMVRDILTTQATEIFAECERAVVRPEQGPFVILVVGVNGVGKTTTIGKLAARFVAEGSKVMLCAADTFRAAAIDQLQVWGDRAGVPVIKQQQGSDPAAVAFDGVQAAKARGMDVLIIDTAGRLHSKTDLMAELAKINKSIGKDLPNAPHETWLVLDATTGQNAVQQAKAFNEVTKLTGLVMTKLDGTAKGGVIIAIADQFKLPIRYIGVGEKATDLRAFDGPQYVQGLFGDQ